MVVHELREIGTEEKCVDAALQKIVHGCPYNVKYRNRCLRPTTGLSATFGLVRFCVIVLTAYQIRAVHPAGEKIGKGNVSPRTSNASSHMAVDDMRCFRNNSMFRVVS